MPINVTLPDGAVRTYDKPLTGMELATSIAPSLAKNALAIKIDGKLKDMSATIANDVHVEILTRSNDAQKDEVLDLIRHDTAHVMAEAVQELFPGTQVTIGPSIEHGFYYDFYREQPFSVNDLEAIEKKMKEIIAKNEPFTREVLNRDDAIRTFKAMGENFKVELIEGLPEGEEISVYKQGKWYDLCRGPHLPSTGKVGTSFKLMKVAGAYWRGDSSKPQLQRIYGTAWRDDKELAAHLHMLEEAEKRDHRKLGAALDLFHLQEESVGNIFWHPNGWTLYRTVENFIRRRIQKDDYVEVRTPQLFDSALFKASGHWDMYGDKMFKVVEEQSHGEPKLLGLKPMNCPAHVQIFKQGMKSYRDLPIRMAEFGSCMRNEPSGSLHGIMRVRGFVQDDAHIFAREDQIEEEAFRYFKLQLGVYKDLGFDNDKIKVKLALRPDERLGDDATWDRAEKSLADALTGAGLAFENLPGEGAFYGPKVEFHLTDAIGREWQCGTLQLDYQLPERLGAEYIGEDGGKHRPVMMHRAILGSMERFIGILIEHYVGAFPVWLAPMQARVVPIADRHNEYAETVRKALFDAHLRADLDSSAERMQKKIRNAQLLKIPYMLVVGDKEAEEGMVAVRHRSGTDLGAMKLADLVQRLQGEADTRRDLIETKPADNTDEAA